MTGHGRDELMGLYEKAVYDVDFEDGRRLYRVGPGDPSQPRFVLITAWNPGTERPGRDTNIAANEELEGVLRALPYEVLPGRGRDQRSSHEEPSFAVIGMPVTEGIEIGRRFRQAAVFYWDGAEGYVIECETAEGRQPG